MNKKHLFHHLIVVQFDVVNSRILKNHLIIVPNCNINEVNSTCMQSEALKGSI